MSTGTAQTAAASAGASKLDGVPIHGNEEVLVHSDVATVTGAPGVSTITNVPQVLENLEQKNQQLDLELQRKLNEISEWGAREVRSILTQTQGLSSKVVADVEAAQLAIEKDFKDRVIQLVGQLDAEKAKKIRELEMTLQKEQQLALNRSKERLNAIESEMNDRKMKMLQSHQLSSAEDLNRLSQLVAEVKLDPVQHTMVINTNTEGSSVMAAAGGGHIRTGAAEAQTVGQAILQAAPLQSAALKQGSTGLKGDLVDGAHRLIGKATTASTTTTVRPDLAQGQGAQTGDGGRKVDAAFPKQIHAVYGRDPMQTNDTIGARRSGAGCVEPTSSQATRRI